MTNNSSQSGRQPDADYIIVGGGSAGCVLANRLSENGKHKVILLEAGGSDSRFWVKVPIGYGKTFFDARVNWKYQTQNDTGTGNRSMYWPRGKLLGGSSSINAMVYMRGLAHDFDDWSLKGNDGWDYRSVLPYFVKSVDSEFEDSNYHQKGGPLHVTRTHNEVHPLCSHYLEAAKEFGFNVTDDFNGANPEGAGIYSITTRRGFRESTATAFLAPARKRKNLTTITHALVEHIGFEGKQATCVTYKKNNQQHTLYAAREIIVSAGAVNSPGILERSGIGRKDILEQHGITPISINNNVGEHLQDHLAVNYVYQTNVPTLNDQLNSVTGKIKIGINYLLNRRGLLSLSVNQAGGFVKSHQQQPSPNLQLYFNPLSYSSVRTDKRELMKPDPFSAYILSFQPCRPTSRGSIHIGATDAEAQPLITPNYLSTNKDIKEVLEGCQLMRQLVNTPALQQITEKEIEPGDAFSSDEDLINDFRERCGTVFHPVGTCAMGPDAASAVVDSRLRVHGIDGLRVVDASIFPNITSGNTNAPTIMVAEKASDLILEDAL